MDDCGFCLLPWYVCECDFCDCLVKAQDIDPNTEED
jgi:hypothetical protein